MQLPLDLSLIASRCKNSYYAPRRFSAVQLAYSEPRCRILIFRKLPSSKKYKILHVLTHDCVLLADTGRLVGTGTSGPVAARIALLRVQRQLYVDAGIKIHIKNFSVINQESSYISHTPSSTPILKYIRCRRWAHSVFTPHSTARCLQTSTVRQHISTRNRSSDLHGVQLENQFVVVSRKYSPTCKYVFFSALTCTSQYIHTTLLTSGGVWCVFAEIYGTGKAK